MKLKLALMIVVLSLLLSGCGYMLVEESPVRVGSPSVRIEDSGR